MPRLDLLVDVPALAVGTQQRRSFEWRDVVVPVHLTRDELDLENPSALVVADRQQRGRLDRPTPHGWSACGVTRVARRLVGPEHTSTLAGRTMRHEYELATWPVGRVAVVVDNEPHCLERRGDLSGFPEAQRGSGRQHGTVGCEHDSRPERDEIS